MGSDTDWKYSTNFKQQHYFHELSIWNGGLERVPSLRQGSTRAEELTRSGLKFIADYWNTPPGQDDTEGQMRVSRERSLSEATSQQSTTSPLPLSLPLPAPHRQNETK